MWPSSCVCCQRYLFLFLLGLLLCIFPCNSQCEVMSLMCFEVLKFLLSQDALLHKVLHYLPSVSFHDFLLNSLSSFLHYTVSVFVFPSQDKLVPASGLLPAALCFAWSTPLHELGMAGFILTFRSPPQRGLIFYYLTIFQPHPGVVFLPSIAKNLGLAWWFGNSEPSPGRFWQKKHS